MALGSLGIVAGWIVAPSPLLSTLLTVGLPLAAMAAYLVAAYVSDRTSLVTLQFADSVYYLGFLFTLISLTVSLLAFTDSGGDGYDLPGAVSRFGVALLTTVVGLACRIYLVNFRTSLDDSLAQSEEALAQAGEALRQRLDQLSQDMTVQSQLMNVSLRGAIDLTTGELRTAAEAGRQTISESTQAVADAVSSATTQVQESAREGGEVIRESLSRLAEELNSTTVPSDLFTSILTPPIQDLAGELEEYAGVLDSTSASHRQVADAASALAEGVDQLRQVGEQLSSTLSDVGEGAGRLASFGQALEGVAAAIQRVTSGLAEHQQLVSRLRTEAERDAGALDSHRVQMRENLEASQQALEQVRTDLVAAARFIRSEIGSGGEAR